VDKGIVGEDVQLEYLGERLGREEVKPTHTDNFFKVLL
jgi:hypothetical protein